MEEESYQVVRTREYYLWLQRVSFLHPMIYDYVKSLPLDLKEDEVKFRAIKDLYYLVNNYASYFKIDAFPDNETGYYLIRFANDFYKIYQIKVLDNLVSFCQRVTLKGEVFQEEDFLDMEDILNYETEKGKVRSKGEKWKK